MITENGSKWFLAICGTNHRIASITDRAPLSLGHDDLASAHMELMNFGNVYEAIVVSTCNRVEFYLVLDEGVEPFNVVKHFYVNYRRLDISELEEKFYTKRELLAVEHLFKVAAGLDSMVLGESQIFGQIKESYSSACMIKSAGKIIHRLFHQAFRTGKLVRTETSLASGASSVGGAAVQLLKRYINGQPEIPILFIGVNQMIHLVASTLAKYGYRNFSFANRTKSKALEMAKQYGGSGHGLDNLSKLLPKTEVIISCTGSTEPILDRSNLAPIVENNADKRYLIMDMAIPRDVSCLPEYSDRVQIFDLEHVDSFLKENRRERKKSIPVAEDIITRKIHEFGYWYDHAKHEPLTERVEHALERIRQEEIAKISKELDPETAKKIDDFSQKLIQRLVTTGRRCKKGNKS